MNDLKKAAKGAVIPQGVDAVLIGEIGPILGISSSVLYQAGSRGQLAIFRVGGKWAVDLSEVQRFAAKRAAEQAAKETTGGKAAAAVASLVPTDDPPPAA
jgi:hypothetical protein